MPEATQQLCGVTNQCHYVGLRYGEHWHGKRAGMVASLCHCLGKPLPAGD
ncbi:hypothetical protein E2C01_046515 [Portunus trituberculatus]|uniref:Uncharacterized protein n=1 Tax=Portunus trituberculatus TaxID=210409 RepID=A0A5B7FY41_PORTR|nr:hypothetical protein [Portunus trituberculatus]